MFYQTTALKKIAALNKKIRIVQGGTSASKTISILQLLIAMAQSDKVPTLTSIVAESLPHLKRGAIRDFKSILKLHNYWNEARWHGTDNIYTFETGSQIEFFGAEDDKKLRGGRRDRGFLNEANLLSMNSFDEFEVRTREFVFCDYNPTSEFWLLTDVKDQRDDTDFVILTYKDNEGCPAEIVKSIEQRRNRKGWFSVYGLGQLGEVEGRIYTGWNEILDIPAEARLERYGLDFGYHPDPAALVAIYFYNGGYILDEIFYQIEMSNREIANTIKNLNRALTVCDSAEPKSIDELRMYGINIAPTVKGADSIRHGIKAVQDQRISVTKRSTNILKEYRNYLWAVDKDGHVLPGVPEGGNDHMLDAVRYGMNSMVQIHRARELIPQMRYPVNKKTNVGI